MTRIATGLPPGLVCYKQTPEFTRQNVPEALLAAHSVKLGVWGLLRFCAVGSGIASTDACRMRCWSSRAARPGGPAPDFVGVLDAMVRERAEALLVLEVPVPFAHRKKVAELAAARRLPAVFPGGQSGAGGLIAYGTSVAETWPRMPVLFDKILKGTDAGELAVERHTRRELVVNLKVAHALGLAVPDEVLKRADRVIE
jgi:hypothetical protein